MQVNKNNLYDRKKKNHRRYRKAGVNSGLRSLRAFFSNDNSLSAGGPAYQTFNYQYVHSSYKGFNQDYNALIKNTHFIQSIKDAQYTAQQENNKLIAVLRNTSDQAINSGVFGDPSTFDHKDLTHSPYGQFFFGYKGILDGFNDFKNLSNTNLKAVRDKNIAQAVKEKPDKWEATDWQRCSSTICSILANLLGIVKGKQTSYTTEIKNLKDMLKRLKQHNKVSTGAEYKAMIKQNTAGSAALLGVLYEPIIDFINEMYVQSTINGAYTINQNWNKIVISSVISSMKSKNVGIQRGITDTMITYTDPTFHIDKIIGFSDKMKQKNQFDIKVNNTDADKSNWVDSFGRDSGLGSASEFWNVLAYIYSSIFALQIFVSSVNTEGNWTNINEVLDDLNYYLNNYINLKILRAGFFGNSVNVGTNAFNENYMNCLDKKMQNYNGIIPSFLLTATNFYATADVFEYYNNQLFGNTNMETNTRFHNAEKSNNPIQNSDRVEIPAGLTKTNLKNLYKIKKQMINNNTQNTIYGRLSGLEPDDGWNNYLITAAALLKWYKSRGASLNFTLKNSSDYT